MATMTVSLPEQMKDWVESLTKKGEYSSSSDYVRDLIRRDIQLRAQKLSAKKLTIEELNELILASEASGISNKSMQDIFDEAKAHYLNIQSKKVA